MKLTATINPEQRDERRIACPLCGNVWGEKQRTSEAYNDDMHTSSRLRSDWACVSGHICRCVADVNSAELKATEKRQKAASIAAWEKLPLLSAKGPNYQTVQTPDGKVPISEFVAKYPEARVQWEGTWFAAVLIASEAPCGYGVHGGDDGNGNLN